MAGRLIGVGSALVDQLAYVSEAFVGALSGGKGGMELVSHPEMLEIISRLDRPPVRVPGGSAANTAVGVARLGSAAGLLAKVGDDDDGRFYVAAAGRAGVARDGFKWSTELPTGTCLSLITPDSERTMRTFLGASSTLVPGDIRVEDFSGFEVVHVEGYLLFNPGLIAHVFRCAKEAGAITSLDLAAPEVVRASRETLTHLLEGPIDIVFANEEEAAEYTGLRDEDAALDMLAKHVDIAVVKLGRRGARIKRGRQTVHIDACTVDATDTTGAGDLWAAGFLHGLGIGLDLADAGRLGAEVSAEVVQVTGAALADETWARLRGTLQATRTD